MLKKLFVAALISHSAIAFAAEKTVYGRYEQVKLIDLKGEIIEAKLDTGAFNASFSALEIELFKKKGKDWVRFLPQAEGKKFSKVEYPLVKVSKIKTRADEVNGDEDEDTPPETYSERPVIEMTLCLGSVKKTIQVNLTDRSSFNYPLLIGATALKSFKAMVDPNLEFVSTPSCTATKKTTKSIYGRYESIKVHSLDNAVIPAKMDTGAYTTSLSATNIKQFEKDGEPWVRFNPLVEGKPLKEQSFPLVKMSKIKKRTQIEAEKTQDDLHIRPVIEMDVCVGNALRTIEVNLTNRSAFRYPLLLGSKALQKLDAVVDPSLKNLSEPRCP